MNQPLTIQLSDEERDRLEAAARQLNLTPETYVYRLLQTQLDQRKETQSALEALRELREIGRQMPLVDAVQLTRQERDQLSERGDI